MNRLLHPFRYLSGERALAWGLVAAVAAAGAARMFGVDLDSMLQFGYADRPFAVGLLRRLAVWLLLGGLLRLVSCASRSRVRNVDIFGTALFARIPFELAMAAGLFFPAVRAAGEAVSADPAAVAGLMSDPALLVRAFGIIDRLAQGHRVEEVPAELQALFRPSVQPYLISSLAVDPRCAVRGTGCPVRIVAGGRDIQIGAAETEALRRARADAPFRLLPRMAHTLKECDTDDPYGQMTTVYVNGDLPLAEGLVAVLVEACGGR